MNAFVRSAAYVRMRAITGSAFLLFGVVIIVRTVMVIGVGVRALAPLIMGLALIALGTLRLREFLGPRRRT